MHAWLQSVSLARLPAWLSAAECGAVCGRVDEQGVLLSFEDCFQQCWAAWIGAMIRIRDCVFGIPVSSSERRAWSQSRTDMRHEQPGSLSCLAFKVRYSAALLLQSSSRGVGGQMACISVCDSGPVRKNGAMMAPVAHNIASRGVEGEARSEGGEQNSAVFQPAYGPEASPFEDAGVRDWTRTIPAAECRKGRAMQGQIESRLSPSDERSSRSAVSNWARRWP